MNDQDLRFFISVYDARNFLRASEALRVTPAAVSLRIRKLEREIGAPLFVRLQRGVRPTAKAAVLYRVAIRAIAAMEDVERAAKPLKGAA